MNNKSRKKPFKRKKGNSSVDMTKDMFSGKGSSKGKYNFGKPNDISWYNKNPLVTKMSSVVNFLKRVGSKFDITQNGIIDTVANGNTNVWNYTTVPGLVTLYWIPTPGAVTDGNSPINWCGSKFFQTLRLKNISISAYDPIDVMFYMLACDSIFAMYAFITMIYGYIKEYKFTNKYYPRAIIESMNVDYDDIVEHIAEYSAYTDVVAERIKILRVPKQMSYIARHMHMSAQIYKDHDDDKAQLYQFIPGYLYEYDPTVPALKPINVGFNTTKLKFADIKSIMNKLTQAVQPDEDLGIIAADIEKFFGGDYWTVNSIDWNSRLEPVYNKEMLWQIHNANFLPYTSVSGNSITQVVDSNLNTIAAWDPVFTTDECGVGYKRIIDSDVPDPSGDEVIESTRLMFNVKDFTRVDHSTYTMRIRSCGSEIIVNATMTQFDNNGKLHIRPYTNFIKCGVDAANNKLYFPVGNWSVPTDDALIGDDFYSLVWGSVFEYRPIAYVTRQLDTAPSVDDQYVGIVAPLNNYAIIEDQQLDLLHENCLMSQFDLTFNTTLKW